MLSSTHSHSVCCHHSSCALPLHLGPGSFPACHHWSCSMSYLHSAFHVANSPIVPPLPPFLVLCLSSLVLSSVLIVLPPQTPLVTFHPLLPRFHACHTWSCSTTILFFSLKLSIPNSTSIATGMNSLPVTTRSVLCPCPQPWFLVLSFYCHWPFPISLSTSLVLLSLCSCLFPPSLSPTSLTLFFSCDAYSYSTFWYPAFHVTCHQ